MLDFGADWCLACKELDATTFSDKKVINLLQKFYVIKVDLTANNAQTKAISTKYNVFAPPSLVFIDIHGNVLDKKNITGYITADKLIPVLKGIQQQ